ncbi:MAG: Ig-like domain-containing protein [Bryobacteraceae bacterium]
MLLRKSTLVVFFWLAALAGFSFGQAQTVSSYIYALPSANGAGPGYAYQANPLTSLSGFQAPAGTFEVLGKPDGSKFYLIANSGATAVSVMDASLNVRTIGGLNLGATAAALSPDGKRLVVTTGAAGSSSGTLYIFDTTTDSQLLPGGIPLSSTPVDVAISLDSTRVLVAGAAASGTVLSTFDLSSLTSVATPLQLPGGVPGVTGVSVAPNGYAYVTLNNRVYEVDPYNPGVVRNEIDVNGVPNKMVFTSDGHYGVSTNYSPATGSNIVMQFDLIAHTVAGTIPNPTSGITLNPKLVVAGNNRIFATSGTTSNLYEISTNPLNITNSSLLNGALPSGVNIAAIAASGEVPNGSSVIAALYVVASANNAETLYRVDLNANTASGSAGIATPVSALSFTSTAPTSGAATILPYNNNQVVGASASSQPLIVRVLDANNRPVWNTAVTFATTNTAVAIQNTSVATSADGFAQTTVTAPSAAGQFTVTAAAGTSATTSFSLSVAGNGSTGGGGTAGTGTTTIVSGNGQLVTASTQTTVPLVVLVKDSNGNPIVATPVTFSVTQGSVSASCGGSLTSCTNGNGSTGGNGNSVTALTDANGLASISVLGSTSLNPGIPYQGSTINATSLNGNVNFSIVTVPSQLAGGGNSTPSAVETAPTVASGRQITAQAGQIVKGAIVVVVVSQTGTPIPGVGLNLVNTSNSSLAAPASCNGGQPLTDATGTASCDLVATGQIGTFSIGVNVGNFNTQSSVNLTVTAGAPGLVAIVQGNNQSGRGGQPLPLALKATVSDGFGNVLPGTPVTWSVTPAGAVTLSNTVNTTDLNGNVSTLVTLGNTPGTAQVKVSVNGVTGVSATFNLTVSVTIGGVTAVSGGNQNGVVNQAFPQPLVVKVTDQQGNPLPGASVSFAVSSGSATVGSTTVTADSSGQASTTVSAGTTPGPIVIIASAGNSSATFNLTSRLPGPVITSTSFVNAAGFQPGIVPCGVATIMGTGLAPGLNGSVTANSLVGAWPTTLAGDTVTLGGFSAPIYSVSNYQGVESVTIQTPCELSPGTTTAQVSVSGGSTTISGVPVLAIQPGLFQYQVNGQNYAIAFRPDGSLISPSNPAHSGETVRFIATGLNQVTPATGTGHLGVPGQEVNAQLVVGLSNSGVALRSAEYMVGAVGLYIVSFDVPAGNPTGSSQPLALAAVGADGVTLTFGNSSLIAVSP